MAARLDSVREQIRVLLQGRRIRHSRRAPRRLTPAIATAAPLATHR